VVVAADEAKGDGPRVHGPALNAIWRAPGVGMRTFTKLLRPMTTCRFEEHS